MIKACMLDMDGTVLNSLEYWRRVERAFLGENGVQAPPRLEDRLCMFDGQRWMEEALGMDEESIWKALAARMDPLYFDEIPPKPGAEAFLAALAEAGVTAWLVTGAPLSHAKGAFARCGLMPAFARMYSVQDLALHKEDAAFFAWMAETLGIGAGELLVVEDSAAIARAAREAGCVVYGIEDPIYASHGALRSACHVTAADFLPLLEALRGSFL